MEVNSMDENNRLRDSSTDSRKQRSQEVKNVEFEFLGNRIERRNKRTNIEATMSKTDYDEESNAQESVDTSDDLFLVERGSPIENNLDPSVVPVEVEEEVIRTVIPIPSHMTQSDPGYDYFVLQRTQITTTTVTRLLKVEPESGASSRVTSAKTKIQKRKKLSRESDALAPTNGNETIASVDLEERNNLNFDSTCMSSWNRPILPHAVSRVEDHLKKILQSEQ